MINLRSVDDQARALQKVLSQYGYVCDPVLVSERVAVLHDGLVHEDEFLYVLSWSKNVAFAHKLDQATVLSKEKNKYRIPDLLMVVNEQGLRQSYLVEIKTTKKEELIWSKNYYYGLLNYSKQIGMQMLVAWKWTSLDIWTLVKLEDFKQANPTASFRLDLKTAYKRSLMSSLLGDFWVFLSDRFSLVLKQKKIKKIQKDDGWVWEAVVEDVYFTGRDGKPAPINEGVLAILYSLDVVEQMDEDENYLYFKLIPSPNLGLCVQTVPIRLNQRSARDQVHWLGLISEGKFPIEYDQLLTSLMEAIESKSIDQILFQAPNYDD